MTPEQNTSTARAAELSRAAAAHSALDRRLRGQLRGNKCLSCHARSRIGELQAPMISITHFTDRDGQFLASVSPRRYFCTQCHVPQHDVKAPVENEFVDIDTLLTRASREGGDDAPPPRRSALSAACRCVRVGNLGQCCAGPARCSASAFWCWRASSPASCSGAPSTPRSN